MQTIEIEEAIKKIAEIQQQKDELQEEQDKLEKTISDYSKAKKLATRKEYEGKYFLLDKDFEFNGIAGFKILKVSSSGSSSYAICIVLLAGHYHGSFCVTGIIKDHLCLWAPPGPCRLRSRLENNNLIDYFKEVTREEFLEAAAAYSLIDEI